LEEAVSSDLFFEENGEGVDSTKAYAELEFEVEIEIETWKWNKTL
jgi:hypothetical protein